MIRFTKLPRRTVVEDVMVERPKEFTVHVRDVVGNKVSIPTAYTYSKHLAVTQTIYVVKDNDS